MLSGASKAPTPTDEPSKVQRAPLACLGHHIGLAIRGGDGEGLLGEAHDHDLQGGAWPGRVSARAARASTGEGTGCWSVGVACLSVAQHASMLDNRGAGWERDKTVHQALARSAP